MGRSLRPAKPSKSSLLASLAVVALIVAAILDTTFLDPEGAADVSAPTFSPAAFVDEEFPVIRDAMIENAVDISELAPAIADDLDAAGEQFGVALGAGRYVFQVRASGSVESVDDDFIELSIPDAPDADVRIPLGSALTGTPVRDATGDIQFGDFPDQTAYQSVANEFKLKMQDEVLAELAPAELEGQQVTVVGAWVSGPPVFIIQPVAIEVSG